jgi:uncharacterized membrane-anchored protein YhcB (DUF1043 family)
VNDSRIVTAVASLISAIIGAVVGAVAGGYATLKVERELEQQRRKTEIELEEERQKLTFNTQLDLERWQRAKLLARVHGLLLLEVYGHLYSLWQTVDAVLPQYMLRKATPLWTSQQVK